MRKNKKQKLTHVLKYYFFLIILFQAIPGTFHKGEGTRVPKFPTRGLRGVYQGQH